MAEPAAALHAIEDDTIIPGHPHAADRRVKPKDPRCITCRFWEAICDGDAGFKGRCRVNPPVVGLAAQAVGYEAGPALWPITEEHDWCSYHQPERRR